MPNVLYNDAVSNAVNWVYDYIDVASENAATCILILSCNSGLNRTWFMFVVTWDWTLLPLLSSVMLFINSINSDIQYGLMWRRTVYPKKYAHGFCFGVLSCGYTLTDFPISIRLTSLALWQSDDCPSASKATLMNMDKYFMWIHYKRLHNQNKAKHNKTVCIFLGIYCRARRHRLIA